MTAIENAERSPSLAPWKTVIIAGSLLILGFAAAVSGGGVGTPPPVAAESMARAAQKDSPAPRPAAIAAPAADPAVVERGRYLVSTSGCHDCHTPFVLGPAGPEPDMTRMLSGHPEDLVMPPPPELGEGPWLWVGSATNTAFAGPWGVSFAANLTPDPSGLEPWDEETFIRAIRTGKHWGQSRPILPPMPWPVYRNMTDQDLGAVYAFLRTIPPVSNHVPMPVPPAGTETAELAPADAVWAD
jgi:mono/diheme cytochrome c family protein